MMELPICKWSLAFAYCPFESERQLIIDIAGLTSFSGVFCCLLVGYWSV